MNVIKDRDDLFCRRDLINYFSSVEVDLITRRCNNHLPHSVTMRSKLYRGFSTYRHYSLRDLEGHFNNYKLPACGRPSLINKAKPIVEGIKPKLEGFRSYLLNGST